MSFPREKLVGRDERLTRLKAKLQLMWESPGCLERANTEQLERKESERLKNDGNEKKGEKRGREDEWSRRSFASKTFAHTAATENFSPWMREENGIAWVKTGKGNIRDRTVEEQDLITVTDAIHDPYGSKGRKEEEDERDEESERKKRQEEEELKKRELTQRSYPGHLVISGESPWKARNSSPPTFQVSSF